MDERESAPYKKYRDFFKGRSIPFTVLLDKDGKSKKEWAGLVAYPQLVDDILAVAAGETQGGKP